MECTTLCKGGSILCQEDIYTFTKSPNQWWQNDKEHLGRDERKEDQNAITVEAGGGVVEARFGKTAIPERREEWTITS